MIIVTGGAGFIGSNIVKTLNQQGKRNILVVDSLEDGQKFRNLSDCDILDYWDKQQFLNYIEGDFDFGQTIEAIFHQGACSDTTEWNGQYMMQNNYTYSKSLLHYVLHHKIPFIYASSAAVYGAGTNFKEARQNEQPLNVYGYSKFLFDQYVRQLLPQAQSQIVGLRYFNVYGPREQHKGSMASVAFHFNQQLNTHGHVKLFEGSEGYANGEQRRDFVFVDDVVDVNLWFAAHRDKSGIFNCGTGRSQTFNDVANAVIDFHQQGHIEYIPFPDKLKGSYQSFTEADINALRQAGYEKSFCTVQEGVACYMDNLQ